PLNNIKYHQLQVIRGTAMAREFREQPDAFFPFTMESYLRLMVEIVELLNPDFVIERVAGEVAPGMGVGPDWGVRYDVILKRFERMLEEQDTWQGKKYQPLL
ncbi:MAG: TIGR01212 family radical SAM protein, partial [Bacteroidota bacterium]